MKPEEFCKLTLEDCKNILETLDLANDAVILAETHGMNPFTNLPEEKYKKLGEPFNKIRAFVKEKEEEK